MEARSILPRVAALVAAVLISVGLTAARVHAQDVSQPHAHRHTPGGPAAPLMSPAPHAHGTQAQAQAGERHGVWGQGHDKLHYWYETLKQPGTGMSCCNDEDCRPTVSRTVGDQVQVEVNGEWATVPPDKIVKSPAPDLGSHVCAPKQAGLFPKGFIYCAVIGSGV